MEDWKDRSGVHREFARDPTKIPKYSEEQSINHSCRFEASMTVQQCIGVLHFGFRGGCELQEGLSATTTCVIDMPGV
uniref:Uncharacterized protein n=1 Tax=Oryza brachyantha TaxID=4533 RepID=J3MXQ4_ORYBR